LPSEKGRRDARRGKSHGGPERGSEEEGRKGSLDRRTEEGRSGTTSSRISSLGGKEGHASAVWEEKNLAGEKREIFRKRNSLAARASSDKEIYLFQRFGRRGALGEKRRRLRQRKGKGSQAISIRPERKEKKRRPSVGDRRSKGGG